MSAFSLFQLSFTKSGQTEYTSCRVYLISCRVLQKADKRSTYLVSFFTFPALFYKKRTSGVHILSALPNAVNRLLFILLILYFRNHEPVSSRADFYFDVTITKFLHLNAFNITQFCIIKQNTLIS